MRDNMFQPMLAAAICVISSVKYGISVSSIPFTSVLANLDCHKLEEEILKVIPI
jgi:hypothetical protein